MMKTLLIALVVVFGLGMTGKKATEKQEAANKELVLAMIQMLFVEHKVDEAIDKYIDPGYIQHNPMAPTGSEPIRTFFKQFYQSTPTATVSIKRVLADGDLVAVHYNAVPKPGDRGLAVVDIFRIADGKIVEHWDVVQPVPEKSANENTMF
jgi:predicted SnoaL-like aldol condensation-catalyzing enzyme